MTDLSSPPTQIRPDSLNIPLLLNSGINSVYIALADTLGGVNPLGSPVPAFALDSPSVSFGSVPVYNSKQDSITVSNNGGLPLNVLSVTSSNSQFSVTPISSTVPIAGSEKFYITFSPASRGTQTGNIIFIHDATGSPTSVPVDGLGVLPIFTAMPAALSFFNVLVGLTMQDSVFVKNTGNISLDITSIGSDNPTQFTVTETGPASIPANDSTWIHVTFHPTTSGLQEGRITVSHNGMTSPDTIHVEGTGYQTVTVNASLMAGWNIISNPVTDPASGDSVIQLYPTSSNPYVFEFNAGYQSRYTLANGIGYWAKFPVATSQPITGIALTLDSIDVLPGWNIVGSMSCPVDTAAIVSVPAGLRGSNWFGYSAGYSAGAQLVPGKGYWVKANAAGTFVLACPPFGASKAELPGVAVEEVLNSMTITDSRGGSQTLYFGADERNNIPVSMYEFPPVPPAGAFDARFETLMGGSMVQTHSRTAPELVVAMQSDAYPVTVTWNVKVGSYELTAGTTDVQTMRGAGSMRITNSQVNRLILNPSRAGEPEKFALAQNYPNPFNPSTVIRYEVPAAPRGTSHVTLKVYNTLGQHVATLVDGEQTAGYKSIEWNASDIVSGIYFYVLRAGDFVAGRKLVLMK